MWLGAKPALVWNHTNFYVKGPSVACAIAKIWPRSCLGRNISKHRTPRIVHHTIRELFNLHALAHINCPNLLNLTLKLLWCE